MGFRGLNDYLEIQGNLFRYTWPPECMEESWHRRKSREDEVGEEIRPSLANTRALGITDSQRVFISQPWKGMKDMAIDQTQNSY